MLYGFLCRLPRISQARTVERATGIRERESHRRRQIFKRCKKRLPASADMDSPSSGFRRAAAASWALTGIGIVGVAGTSVLAYTDTVKAPPAPSPAGVVELAPSDPGLGAVPPVAPAPEAETTTTVDPPPPLMVAVEQEPESGETSDYRPDYTPEYTPEYTPRPPPRPPSLRFPLPWTLRRRRGPILHRPRAITGSPQGLWRHRAIRRRSSGPADHEHPRSPPASLRRATRQRRVAAVEHRHDARGH